MQNLRKTNETGRSMLEMLGVLAIIGVLSVAGVAWFHPGPGWNNSGYLLLKYEGCGWPYDGKLGTDKKTCCSVEGYAWRDAYVGYNDVKTQICGCPMPNDGTTHAPVLGTDGKTCCRDGLTWYDANRNYTAASLYCGGCPEDGKVGKDSKTCCKDGKYWHDYEVGYFYESEVCQGIYPPPPKSDGGFLI